MLGIAIGQVFGYFFLIFIHIFPTYANDSTIGKKISELEIQDFEKWKKMSEEEKIESMNNPEQKDLDQDMISVKVEQLFDKKEIKQHFEDEKNENLQNEMQKHTV